MIWMPVFEWEGIYEVSTTGKVRSCRTGNCLKPYIASGYERVILQYRPGKPDARIKVEGIHRIVLAAHTKMMPKGRNGIVCCHKNGNKRDNRLENLEWKSPLANMLDKNKHGTMPKGEGSHYAKITEKQALEIIQRLEKGEAPMKIASDFPQVGPNVIYSIRKKESWKHIWDTYSTRESK